MTMCVQVTKYGYMMPLISHHCMNRSFDVDASPVTSTGSSPDNSRVDYDGASIRGEIFSYSSQPASASPALVPLAGRWACLMVTPIGLLLVWKADVIVRNHGFSKTTVEVEPFPQKGLAHSLRGKSLLVPIALRRPDDLSSSLKINSANC